MVNFLALSLLLVAGTRLVFAEPFNVTVDDKFGSFPQSGSTIHFGEGWFESGVDFCPAPGCDDAVFRQAFNQTWKRSTYETQSATDRPKVATFSFKGTAVYVNAITNSQTGAGVAGNSDMTFLLDDQVSYFLSKAPNFPIARTVFSATGLVDQDHHLTIVNGHLNSSFAAVMMFLDSIIYTTDSLPDNDSRPGDGAPVSRESSTNVSPRSNVPIIIGVSVGVGGVILSLLSCWLYLRVRARKAQARQSLSSSSNGSRTSLMQRVTPFLAYKSPLPPRHSGIFDARGNDVEMRPQSPLTSPAFPHRPETTISTVPPSYRSRRSAVGAP